MIKFLIVTHGPLAEAFKESLRMFFGDKADEVDVIGLYPTDAVEGLKQKIANSIEKNYSKDGMMIFVDIYAGSPFNMVAYTMHDLNDVYPQLECFTGVNLTMLMEAFADSESLSLERMCEQLEVIAPASIINVKKLLET